MGNYSPHFANYYDIFIGGYKRQHTVIKKLIQKHHPKSKSLLEIACGTGNMLLPFKRSHTLSGLDISKDMLKIAKKKIPKAAFYERDMSNFSLGKKFDVILCFYDAINHLLSFSKWESMFGHVEEHLNPNGIFIFDLTTMYRMIQRSKDPILVTKRGGVIITAQVKRPNLHTFKSRFQIIYKKTGSNWECIEEYVLEKCYETDKVMNLINKYFTVENIVDPFQDKPNKKSKILLFVCRPKA